MSIPSPLPVGLSAVSRRAKICLLVSAVFHAALLFEHLPAWLTLVCGFLYFLEFSFWEFTVKWVRREMRSLVLVAGGLGLTLSYAPYFGIEPAVSFLIFVTSVSLLGATSVWVARLNVFLYSALIVLVNILYDEFWVILASLANVLGMTILFFELNAHDRRQLSLLRYLRSALVLTLPIGIVVVALFTLLPRFYRGLFVRSNIAVMGFGSSQQLAPGDVSRMARSQRKAFRVRFTGSEKPVPAQLYWRGEVFDISDGMRWKKDRQQILTNVSDVPAKHPTILHDIFLEPRFDTALFALDVPLQLSLENSVDLDVEQTTGRIFELGGSARRVLYYHVLSVDSLQEESLTETQRKRYTAIANPLRTARIDLLMKRLNLDTRDPEGAVVKLSSFFSTENFKYTLSPGVLKGNALESFLFENRAGFCEHFSASSATLLRHAGIPARVVTGFQGADSNRFDSLLTVRDSNAHAWVEFWSDKTSSWKRFDPTASVAPERIERGLISLERGSRGFLWGSFLDQSMQALDALSVSWNSWMVDTGTAWPQNEWSSWLKGWDAWVTKALAAILTLAVVVVVIRKFRRRQTSAESIDAELLEIYQSFCEFFRKQGIVREVSEGPLTFLAKCTEQYPTHAQALSGFIQAYIDLRYANPHVSKVSALDLKRLRALLKQVEVLVRDKKSQSISLQS